MKVGLFATPLGLGAYKSASLLSWPTLEWGQQYRWIAIFLYELLTRRKCSFSC